MSEKYSDKATISLFLQIITGRMNQEHYSIRIRNTVSKLTEDSSFQQVCHEHKAGEPMPSVIKLKQLVDTLREILFPGYFGDSSVNPYTVKYHIGVNTEKAYELLCDQILAGICFACADEEKGSHEELHIKSMELSTRFLENLPQVREKLIGDVTVTFNGDPAAHSNGEVIFCYPSIKAISNYRLAHELVKLGIPLIPRIISEMAHSETGIDIHPEAKIGEKFSIDHGTGVVVGATAIIGDNVKLFQGVTLGAKNFPLDEDGNPIKGIPRHPILEDDVIIYSNATILGRITIGKGSVIGGNVWVTNSVPPFSKIVQVKARDTYFFDGSGI